MSIKRKAYLALILITVLWGISFPVMDACLKQMGPFTFVGLRYLFAALAMSLAKRISGRRGAAKQSAEKNGLGREWKRGIYIGIPFAFAAAMQMIGLQKTNVANASFLTALPVVFVPLLAFILDHKTPSGNTIAGIVLSLAGVMLMTGLTGVSVNTGDLWVLLSAIAFSVQIYHLEKYGSVRDAGAITEIMLWLVALMTLPIALTAEWGTLKPTWMLVPAFIFISIVCTVWALLIQNRMQPQVPASHAAVLYLLEPVTATAVSLFAGEGVRGNQIAGGILILLGTLAITLLAKKEKHIENKQAD